MIYRKMNFDELSKVSGGWLPSPIEIAEPVGRAAWSLWKHRRSYCAGYQASPFH